MSMFESFRESADVLRTGECVLGVETIYSLLLYECLYLNFTSYDFDHP